MTSSIYAVGPVINFPKLANGVHRLASEKRASGSGKGGDG